MKIGVVYIHALRQGGYPKDIRWLVQKLTRYIDVTLFTDAGWHFDGLADAAVKVKSMANVWEEIDQLELIHITGLFLPKHAWFISRLVSRKIPIIVSPMGHLMPFAMRVKRWKKEIFLKVLSLWLKRVVFHGFGPAEEESIRTYFPDSKSFMAPLGIFPCPINLDKQKMDERKHPLQLLFFGRNDIYQKGIDILLEGFAIAAHHGVDAHLTIAGQPWKESSGYINNAREKYRLNKLITVIGPVKEEEKWRLLADVDCLIFLSRWDGPPRPIREAISVGTLVIVSPETNMGHLVEEYSAGFEVALDPSAVANVILHLASAPELLRSFSEGTVKLHQRLEWERVAQDYIQGYKTVLGLK
jgi:glycosyltransferase involved in cell wall biosynthesis